MTCSIGLGARREVLELGRVCPEIDAIVRRDLRAVGRPVAGSVRLATVDQAAGARAPYVILADLAEGAFPDRAAVEPFLAPGARRRARPGRQEDLLAGDAAIPHGSSARLMSG